jgi:Xaa-Pro aminopeptidase
MTYSQPNFITQYPKIVDKRFHQLRFNIEENKCEAAVITKLSNIRYLTNFSGSSAYLFVTDDEVHFVTDDRYEEQIKTELYDLPNLQVHITRDVWGYLAKSKFLNKVENLGFEADHIPYGDAVEIRNRIRPLKFKPISNLVERFTYPKAPEELEYIKQACKIAEKVYEEMLGFIQPGMTEKEIAIEIAYRTRKLGSEGDPFDIIAVSGPRTALVHGKPSDRKIKKNDIILLDFGAKVQGFGSDITRTFCVGKATKEQKAIYKLVYDAKQAACEAARPGMNGKLLDAVARKMIDNAGYGINFQHSLGHGIGLEAHEGPIITFRREDQIIPEDVVLAIEPGVYFPDKFGMRVEDDIYITRNEITLLTNAPAELIVI